MKHLFYVANIRLPSERAHGIQLVKMCEAFIDSGVELTLIIPRKKQSHIEEIQSYYGLRHHIHVIGLPILDFGQSRLGFNITSLSFMISSFFFLLFEKVRGKIELIYTIDLDQFSYSLLPLFAPVFIEVHGSKPSNIFLRFFFGRVRGVIAISQKVRRSIAATYKVPEEKIFEQRNGVDVALFESGLLQEESRKKAGLKLEGVIFLYSGAFYDWKGLGDIIEAAETVGGEVSVVMVGGTEGELITATKRSSLPPNIICIAKQKFKNIPLWLRTADYFIISGTRTNYYSFKETSPMKLYEYFTIGRPVIAARTEAIEYMTDEREVMFYEPDNAADLARVMKVAIGRDFTDMKKHAYQKASRFSLKNRAKHIMDFIASKI